jgi:hypothetical protein
MVTRLDRLAVRLLQPIRHPPNPSQSLTSPPFTTVAPCPFAGVILPLEGRPAMLQHPKRRSVSALPV